MPSITHQLITSPGIGGDGLGLCDGQHWDIEDCIIDLSQCPLDKIDECAGITWGSDATFRRCVIRGAGKLVLCGSGDGDKAGVETGKTVSFFDCIFEDGGRRFPEVQSDMCCELHNCLIRNWGSPDRFTVRSFGSWAHSGGRVHALGCVYWQDRFWRPIGQMLLDIIGHVGQAWNDKGLRGVLNPFSWLPGVCRGLTAGPGGTACGLRCWKNHWWIAMPAVYTTMSKREALALIERLEAMQANLETELAR